MRGPNGPSHVVLVAALVATTAMACGGRQRDFGPIGYGWPVQCGEVRQQYRDRVAAAEASTPDGAPDGARHLAASITAAALEDTASALVEDYERRANERLAEDTPGEDAPTVDLDADGAQVRTVDGVATLDIGVAGSLELPWSDADEGVLPRQLSLSARMQVGLALEHDGGAAEIMVDPATSGLHDIAFDDETPEAEQMLGTGDAVTGIVQRGIRSALEDPPEGVRVARLEPFALGDSDVTLTPVELRAVSSTNELVVTFRTNLAVDAAHDPAGLVDDSDAAVWVDADVLGPLLRTLTESIGGREIDKKGRPGGNIRAFINDVDTEDGRLVAIQEGYNVGFPCSWTVTRMVASFDIDGDDLTVTVHELTPIAASRQQWLVNLASPDPSVIAGNMSEQLGRFVTPPSVEMAGQSELTLRLTDILPNPDGVVIRAVIDAAAPDAASNERVLLLRELAARDGRSAHPGTDTEHLVEQ